MNGKKNFNSLASKLVSMVDFIKWTSSFNSDAIKQMEVPLSGIRLAPALTIMFGVAEDELGYMIVMPEAEGKWLENFPLAEAYIGFDDGIILATQAITILDQPFEPIAIHLFIPQIDLRQTLRDQNLIGFGIMRSESNAIERVNKLVPLYNPDSYEALRNANLRKPSRGLFSQT